METPISQLGKGALPRLPDPRDIQYGDYIAGAPAVDWSRPYDVRTVIGDLPVNNQGGSLSCVGQASSKLAEIAEAFEAKKQTRLSARDVYSRIYVPEGGAYGYRGLSAIVQRGVATEQRVPSYLYPDKEPPTEAFMRTQDNSPEAVEEAKVRVAGNYAHLSQNIDEMAYAIEHQNGIVFGVVGTNEAWNWGITIPRPPQSGESVWYHFVVGVGFKIINGKKHIVVLNSWSEQWGDNGYCYIPEDYITGGWTFNAMTLIDLPNPPEKIFMKRVIRVDGRQDQFTVEGNRKQKIPDLETRAFLRDEVKVIPDAEPEVVSKEYFDSLMEGPSWASVKVDRLARDFHHATTDAYTNE